MLYVSNLVFVLVVVLYYIVYIKSGKINCVKDFREKTNCSKAAVPR